MRAALPGLILACLILAGCTNPQPPAPTPTQAPVAAATFEQIYSGASRPARVRNVEGIALFNTAIEASAEGSDKIMLFVLVNRKNPTEGILVRTRSTVGLDFFKALANEPTSVSGQVSPLNSPELIGKYKADHSVTLATDKSGQPICIDSDTPFTPPATASPAASPSAAPTVSPGSSRLKEQRIEDTPFDRILSFVFRLS